MHQVLLAKKRLQVAREQADERIAYLLFTVAV